MENKQKILIVYYSLSGNTKFIAKAINEVIDADMEELKPEKELKVGKASTYFWGGAQVYMKKRPKLKSLKHELSNYDLIFIGTPVWAWNYSPPIRSYLYDLDLIGKKFAIWTSAGGPTEKAIKRLKARLEKAGAEVVGQIRFIEPLKNNTDEMKIKAQEWASSVKII
ncbi:MAG: flavodoxin family protein [Promethearchaeota archaeon]